MAQMEYSGRPLPGMNGKTEGKRKETNKDKAFGEEERRDGNIIGRAYSRCGVRATSKGSIFECAYPELSCLLS